LSQLIPKGIPLDVVWDLQELKKPFLKKIFGATHSQNLIHFNRLELLRISIVPPRIFTNMNIYIIADGFP
jgi:hypothetical protein